MTAFIYLKEDNKLSAALIKFYPIFPSNYCVFLTSFSVHDVAFIANVVLFFFSLFSHLVRAVVGTSMIFRVVLTIMKGETLFQMRDKIL